MISTPTPVDAVCPAARQTNMLATLEPFVRSLGCASKLANSPRAKPCETPTSQDARRREASPRHRRRAPALASQAPRPFRSWVHPRVCSNDGCATSDGTKRTNARRVAQQHRRVQDDEDERERVTSSSACASGILDNATMGRKVQPNRKTWSEACHRLHLPDGVPTSHTASPQRIGSAPSPAAAWGNCRKPSASVPLVPGWRHSSMCEGNSTFLCFFKFKGARGRGDKGGRTRRGKGGDFTADRVRHELAASSGRGDQQMPPKPHIAMLGPQKD